METTKRDRTPIYGLLFICGLIAVFGLFAFAMSISGWMLFGLVVCLGLVGALILVFQWGYTTTRLMWQKEQNRHVEAYSKTKLDMLKAGYNPDDYTPITRQIAAPVEPVAQIVEPPDPRREHALRLLTATIESPKYGTGATRIMPQKEAGAVGIIADDWSAGVAYLFNYGVMTGNGGTLIKDGKTISRLMADVARGQQDAEASGVMALPEGKR